MRNDNSISNPLGVLLDNLKENINKYTHVSTMAYFDKVIRKYSNGYGIASVKPFPLEKGQKEYTVNAYFLTDIEFEANEKLLIVYTDTNFFPNIDFNFPKEKVEKTYHSNNFGVIIKSSSTGAKIDIGKGNLTIKNNVEELGTFNANSKNDVTITVPRVTDTYSSTSGDAMSGVAVESAVSVVREIAEGKTKTYVANNKTSITFVSETTTGLNGVSSIKDQFGEEIDLNEVKIGDSVYLIEIDDPDYWVSGKTSIGNVTTLTLSILETSSIYNVLKYVYPVGSIYMSVNNVSPATFIGGTWIPLQDRFLIGAGDNYTANSTGGSTTHTPSGTLTGGAVESHILTIDEMPSHAHGVGENGYFATGNKFEPRQPGSSTSRMSSYVGGGQGHTHPFTQPTFNGTSQNTMPPYLAVYMWKRTA